MSRAEIVRTFTEIPKSSPRESIPTQQGKFVLARLGGGMQLSYLTSLIEQSPEAKADLARENQRLEAFRKASENSQNPNTVEPTSELIQKPA